jgi:murein DD-endopeptidase MepM/ murein hydrolase activator NlpD
VADGTVVTAVDGAPENVPESLNPNMGTGNMVILQHEPGLFSACLHLQPGSITVKPGAKVKRGKTLGLCGNSGNSIEPHLHFQLQDGPLFAGSWGIEAVFPEVAVTRNGTSTTMAAYTFLKGDRVHSMARAPTR